MSLERVEGTSFGALVAEAILRPGACFARHPDTVNAT